MKASLSLLVILSLTFGFLCLNAFAGGIGWEAEDAIAINAPLQIFEDKNSSAGKYVASPTSNQGSAEYEFEVPVNGTYFMWAHHLSIDAGRNSYYLVIDEPKSPLGNDDLVWDTFFEPLPKKLGEEVNVEGKDKYSNEWQWIRVLKRVGGLWNIQTIRTFELKRGKHEMYIWTRERETKVDCFYLAGCKCYHPYGKRLDDRGVEHTR